MIVLSWLWGIVKSVLNGIAKLVAFAVILIIILAGIGLVSGDGLPSNMVLELDARKSIEDKTASSILDLGQRSLSVMDIVMTLDTAQRDARVKGVFIRVGSGDLSVPKAEELRDALKRFQGAGKFVIAHSQSFYSGGLGDYVVAAASDEIWMQPVSSFFSAGSSTSALFLKGLFDKVEATPQFVQRYEYKNVANMFTQTDFTAPHREAAIALGFSVFDLGDGDRERNQTVYGVLRYKPLDALQLGVEYAHWRTRYKAAPDGVANRVDLHASVLF